MEDVFVVCGMLHNALVIVDGGWEQGVSMECAVNHGSADLFVEEEGEDDVLEVDTSTENNVLSTLLSQATMMDINESNAMSIEENGAWASFDSKVHALVIHYGHCYNKGELHWVRKSSEGISTGPYIHENTNARLYFEVQGCSVTVLHPRIVR